MFTRCLKQETGQSLIEYSVLLGLLALAVFGVVALMGNEVSARFGAIDAALVNVAQVDAAEPEAPPSDDPSGDAQDEGDHEGDEDEQEEIAPVKPGRPILPQPPVHPGKAEKPWIPWLPWLW